MNTANQPPKIPSADTREALGFKREQMTRWFHPMFLLRLASQVIVSNLFGDYVDKREIQAVFKDTEDIDYHKSEELWFDYTADLGDGWNSTYTIAKILAEPTLKLTATDGSEYPTKRGHLLIMGGDQVYPAASRDAYRNRTEAPYRCALPWLSENHPHLYAIPGNHDWYGGLTSFTRLFCQKRWIGAWRTQQSTSYFARRLPHGWWLFAVDIQLGADIDKPQLDYFDNIIRNDMAHHDKVIFASAKPAWILAHFSGEAEQENIAFLEKRILEKGRIYVNVAGDMHHYAHYQNRELGKHKITAGGGGAFLHGTHTLPADIKVKEASDTNKYTIDNEAIFPSREQSNKLLAGNLCFPARNWELSLFLGVLYLFTCWIMQNASVALHKDLFANINNQNGSLIWLYWDILKNSASSIIMLALFIVGFIAFTEPLSTENTVRTRTKKVLTGLVHGSGHVFLLIFLTIIFIKLNTFFGLGLSSLKHTAAFSLEMLTIGSLCAGTLMGIYLYLTARIFKFHPEASFSSNRIEDYKNILRFHINKDGNLTIYPIGVKQVEKQWRLNKEGKAGETWFVPANGRSMQSYTHLIEAPIKINAVM